MTIRKATTADIDAIMACITDAQALLRSHGVDQWQDGYPTAEIILADIARGESFVVIEDKSVVATAVISFAGEPTYTTIEGQWLNDNPYAVIHRLAVRNSARGKGYAKAIFDYTEQLCTERGVSDIRVDTHADNRIMQRLLDGLGYSYCGVITLLSGAKRIALQKRL
jgi:ribosomal protein S18 acetylase RimI-like enzyme